MKNKVIYVDYDNTLSNCQWRDRFLKMKPRDWDSFYAGIIHDEPFHDILTLVKTLHQSGSILIGCTGRPEEYRGMTEEWNKKHSVPILKTYMRQTKDYRDDTIVKWELVEQMRADGFDPYLCLEDRNKVVNHLRSKGLRVLQVRDGNF